MKKKTKEGIKKKNSQKILKTIQDKRFPFMMFKVEKEHTSKFFWLEKEG